MGDGVLLVARREFVERGRSRVFLGVLVGSMLLIVAGMFAISLVGRPAPSANLAVAGGDTDAVVAAIERSAAAVGLEVEVVVLGSAEEASTAVREGAVVAALVDGSTIVAEGSPPRTVETVLRQAATTTARAQAAAELGLTDDDLNQVLDPVDLQLQDVAPVSSPAGDPMRQARAAAAFASVVVLFILVMAFGQFVGSAVVEEKQTRVAELILAKISTAAMLVGKVLGIGGLGLVQLAVLGLTYLASLRVFGEDSAGIDLFRLGLWPLVWLALWFVLGYAMYSFLFATMGATVSRLEDLQSLTYVPSVLLLPAYVVAGISLTAGPGPLLAAMSILPWWAPLLMPFRMVTGDAPVWQVLVALLGSLAFIAFLVWFGARVYRGAALRTGGRVSLREAYRTG